MLFLSKTTVPIAPSYWRAGAHWAVLTVSRCKSVHSGGGGDLWMKSMRIIIWVMYFWSRSRGSIWDWVIHTSLLHPCSVLMMLLYIQNKQWSTMKFWLTSVWGRGLEEALEVGVWRVNKICMHVKLHVMSWSWPAQETVGPHCLLSPGEHICCWEGNPSLSVYISTTPWAHAVARTPFMYVYTYIHAHVFDNLKS